MDVAGTEPAAWEEAGDGLSTRKKHLQEVGAGAGVL